MNEKIKKILSETTEETKQKARDYGNRLAYNSNTIGIEKIFFIQKNTEPILLFINYKAMQGEWITSRKVLRKLVKENLHFFTKNGRIELHSYKFRNRSDIESFNNIMLNKVTPDNINIIIQLTGEKPTKNHL